MSLSTQPMRLQRVEYEMRPGLTVLVSVLICLWQVDLGAQSSGSKSPIVGLIFKRLDANGDGKVTKAELELQGRKTEWIAQADDDGDGALSLTEIQKLFQKRSSENQESDILVHEIPEGAPVDEASCRSAGEYSAGMKGFSTLIMVDGSVIFERYDEGWAPETANRLASGTKSFSGALLAAAVQDGLLTLDEPLVETLTEWGERPELRGITIRHLLSLCSGLDPGENGSVPSYAEAVIMPGNETLINQPGEKFSYGPRAYQIFGELLRRKLEARDELEFADPLAYLESRIFEPIQLSYANWRRDENGMPHLPSGAFLTAREWAKFGELLRNEGKHGKDQILDVATLRECLSPSPAQAGYGLTFWLLDNNKERLKGRPWLEGAYMAAGAGKQRLYVLPSVGVVAVRQGDSTQFEDVEMLDRLFAKD